MTATGYLDATEKTHKKDGWYAGTDSLKAGYVLCYDRDYGTASESELGRAWQMEQPAAGNLANMAGIVCKTPSKSGAAGKVTIMEPTPGTIMPVWTDQSCTAHTTLLTVQASSYALGGLGEGPVVAIARQTVDRSSTAGLVLAEILDVPAVKRIQSPWNLGTPSSSNNCLSKNIWETCPWDLLVDNPNMGIAFFDDFMGPIDVTSADGWVITQVTTGALAPVVTHDGGALLVDSAGHTSADDGVNAQLTNCLFKLAAGRKLWFESRCKFKDAGDDQYFMGLAGVDTTLIAAGVVDDVVDKAGFFRHAASTADKISSIVSRTSAEDSTADVADIADDTWVNLGFVLDGLTSVKFYVNGTLVETGTTVANLPNAVMCLSMVAQVEQTSADAEMTVDWVRIAQYGRT